MILTALDNAFVAMLLIGIVLVGYKHASLAALVFASAATLKTGLFLFVYLSEKR